MNINDVGEQVVHGDRLKAIFARQLELMTKYKEIEGMPDWPMNPHTKESQKWFKDFAWRMTEEIAEAVEALDEADTAQVNGDEEGYETNIKHFNEELADALHFLVEHIQIIGITPEEIVGEIPDELSDMDMLGYLYALSNKALEEWRDQTGDEATFADITMDCIVELGKAMNCLKNKPWKQTQILTDIEKFRGLMCSTFVAFIVVLAAAGLDDTDITNLYFKKSEVNKFRQRSNY